MTNKLPTREPAAHSDIAAASLSRPEYSPSKLVVDVVALLTSEGLSVPLVGERASTAMIAAADLLRALGVQPATAPERGNHG